MTVGIRHISVSLSEGVVADVQLSLGLYGVPLVQCRLLLVKDLINVFLRSQKCVIMDLRDVFIVSIGTLKGKDLSTEEPSSLLCIFESLA